MKRFPFVLMVAAFAVPLKSKQNWQDLQFRKLAANKVSFREQGLKIEVNKSSSPLIYPLPKPLKVTGIRVKGHVSGLLELEKHQKQGDKGADDFVLKIGLVSKGEKTLNFIQRSVAPDWVKKLFSLAPKGTGVERIFFLNAAQQKNLMGQQRVHPLSELIYERYQWHLDKPGAFQLSATLTEPVTTLALWLSSDGDDTKSSYTVTLTQLTFETE